MKNLQYLVRINKDPETDWGASVPDLPGCVATGKTIDSALRRIQGPIALRLRGLQEDGIKPKPATSNGCPEAYATNGGLLRDR
jgi:predicted RNase H-like HicB family nuclease